MDTTWVQPVAPYADRSSHADSPAVDTATATDPPATVSITTNGQFCPDATTPKEYAMDFAIFIPITLFICIVAAIKVIVDGRMRRRLVETNGSEDLVKAMLLADEQNRRFGALKWGMVLTLVGGAFFAQQLLNLGPQDPATYGLLFVASGLGMLGYHFMAGKSH